jgi:hypothetical protein
MVFHVSTHPFCSKTVPVHLENSLSPRVAISLERRYWKGLPKQDFQGYGRNISVISNPSTQTSKTHAQRPFSSQAKPIQKHELRLKIEELLYRRLTSISMYDEELIKTYGPTSRLSTQMMNTFYETGDAESWSSFFHCMNSHFSSEEQKDQLVLSWVNRIRGDYLKGEKQAFPFMTRLITNNNISRSIETYPPFNCHTLKYGVLKDLAFAEVKDAQFFLVDYLLWNEINGDCLNLSMDERLGLLQKLTDLNCAEAQQELAGAYYFNHLGLYPCYFSNKERTDRLKQIMNNELGNNFIISKMIWENAFPDLQENLSSISVEDSISNTLKRAKNGDKHSLRFLIDTVVSNQSKFSLHKLTKNERLNWLNVLSEIDPEQLDTERVDWMLHNQIGSGKDAILLELSIEERIEALETIAFAKNNSYGQSRLAEIYAAENSEISNKFNQSFAHRATKLYQLGLMGCSTAAFYAAKYYTGQGKFRCLKDEGEALRALFSIVTAGKHYKVGREYLTHIFKEEKDPMIDLLLANLQVLENTR